MAHLKPGGRGHVTTPTGPGSPAGWYPDSEQPGMQRYWDGSAWTDHRAPAQATGSPPAMTEPTTSSPSPAPQGKKPLWKRWWVWAVAVVLLIGIASAASGGGDKASTSTAGASPTTSATDSAAPSAPSSDSATPTAGSPAPANPTAEARAAFDETFGTFAPITKAGKGDSIIKLPAGVKAGLVTMTYKGSSNFIVEVLDSSNQSTGDSLANEIGSWSGAATFGTSSIAGEPAKIQVQAQGSWSIKIAPVSTAPAITFPAAKKGTGVYLYVGDASDWAITHRGTSNFIVYAIPPDGSFLSSLVNEIGNYSGTVAASAGPVLVTVQADGTWTIKPA